MREVPAGLAERLRQAGQEHVLAGWDGLDDSGRAGLLEQLQALDLGLLARLHARREQKEAVPDAADIRPLTVQPDQPDSTLRAAGEAALRRGEVAALVVAGGQGTRLGFDHPKGMFPVGPVTGRTLFQFHAEKVLALSRRYGRPVPFLVMTSHATHAETEAYFREHRHFGLPADDVHFFRQGTMPALDLATGRLLLERPGVLFASPNGHGGTLTALADSGLLAALKERGIRQVFYFQVDNPLVRVADPVFLGRHLAANAEVSSRVVPKASPTEKVGLLAEIGGRCGIIEYSDLPDELAHARNPDGSLRFGWGNPAIHLFSVPFLERITADGGALPYHLARKKVPFWDPATGASVTPEKENALKFERFIFDALPLADRWTAVATSRREEFEPLKNATGPNSPETVKRALSRQAADWLAAAGVEVSRDSQGEPAVALEVAPTYALDASDLAAKYRGGPVTGPLVLE
jgi:UDP-N-acetylglucosamine/UDP-N-acetylgalactosamine diphosphorylase